jgi:hypothetical protein
MFVYHTCTFALFLCARMLIGSEYNMWVYLIIDLLSFIIELMSYCLLIDQIGQLCERSHNNFLSTYRKIDGAEIISKNERNLDCTLTFQTHSILQRFMLRFEVLKLDCNDHLYIYDGAHSSGIHKADVSCRNTKQNIGTLFTRTNYITLKYVTDNWGSDNSFKLIITAIKDGSNAWWILSVLCWSTLKIYKSQSSISSFLIFLTCLTLNRALV